MSNIADFSSSSESYQQTILAYLFVAEESVYSITIILKHEVVMENSKLATIENL